MGDLSREKSNLHARGLIHEQIGRACCQLLRIECGRFCLCLQLAQHQRRFVDNHSNINYDFQTNSLLLIKCSVENYTSRARSQTRTNDSRPYKQPIDMADDSVIDLLHIELVNSMPEKLEQVGYMTGYRYTERLTADMLRFNDEELDVMKFICREFWSSIFQKQIDNLRTNRSGQYVLHENKFRFITRISNGKQYLELMPRYLAFTCGLIKGALADFGINATVYADSVNPPACIFNVQIHRGMPVA